MKIQHFKTSSKLIMLCFLFFFRGDLICSYVPGCPCLLLQLRICLHSQESTVPLSFILLIQLQSTTQKIWMKMDLNTQINRASSLKNCWSPGCHLSMWLFTLVHHVASLLYFIFFLFLKLSSVFEQSMIVLFFN